jgi:hypothetical protein
MTSDGWLDKPNVICMFGKWQDFFDQLYQAGIKFDGLYYDTWDEEQEPFNDIVHNFIKPSGVFTFFNNHRFENLQMVPVNVDALSVNFDIKFETFDLGEVPQQHKDGRNYWDPKLTTYHNPIMSLKNNKDA